LFCHIESTIATKVGIPNLNRHRLSVEKNATNVPANETAPGAAGAEVGAELQSLQRSFPPDSINEFIQKMTGGGQAKMIADHDNLRQNERHVLHFMKNPMKNRFSNILLFSEGAVVLEVTKHDKSQNTYIHATKIKSKFGNYVLAQVFLIAEHSNLSFQSPKPETLLDWFRMIWQLKIRLIVCLIPLDNKDDCAKYFERKVGKKLKHKRFTVRTFAIRTEEAATTYELRITNSDIKRDERILYVLRYPHWKEIVRPPDPRQFLEVIKSAWALEQTAGQSNIDSTSPTLVHGISGTRRTGAFVLTSMLCRQHFQMRERQQLSVVTACSTVRKYRYGVMRNRVCYTVMLEAILRFAAAQGYVNGHSSAFLRALEVICNSFNTSALRYTYDDSSL
uniref:Tyrosine-protein phosphatase domain-containing protein n=1 Tax=Ascaris lumbricoides TaxID=6252 RepID=A0A0M3IFH0_ASCLU